MSSPENSEAFSYVVVSPAHELLLSSVAVTAPESYFASQVWQRGQ
jgi:hypothetical protein